jgi:hypothetical protein
VFHLISSVGVDTIKVGNMLLLGFRYDSNNILYRI